MNNGEIVYIAKGIASATTTIIIMTISSTEIVLLINHKTRDTLLNHIQRMLLKVSLLKHKKTDVATI
jgi:hypothetical protein